MIGRPKEYFPADLDPRAAKGRARDAHARALVERLHDGRPHREPVQLLGSPDDREGCGGDPVMGEDLFRASLVEAQGEGQGIAARVGHRPELADGGHVGLADGAVQALGDVEDDVGARLLQPEGEIVRGFQADHVAGAGEGGLDAGDGLLVLPLRVTVVEVGRRDARLHVERESDAQSRPRS